MNFQTLRTVERAKTYLDIAFKRARKLDKPKFTGSKDKVTNIKSFEYSRLKTASTELVRQLDKIITSFPSIDELPEFYSELVRITVDYVRIKKSLAAVKWARTKVDNLSRKYLIEIRKSRNIEQVKTKKRQFYGRVSSVVKQIDENLAYIEETRKIMKNFPAIKTSVYTVAITGFPNVGKSSLLKKLTGANPQIKNYAFTTKSLNMGYMDGKEFQFIDTPGTLDREHMNIIEKQAYLAIKLVADLIIFLIDPTESCGYKLKKQLELLKNVKKFNKPTIIVYTKYDMYEKLGIQEQETKELIHAKDEKIHYVSVKNNNGIKDLTRLIKDNKTNCKKENN